MQTNGKGELGSRFPEREKPKLTSLTAAWKPNSSSASCSVSPPLARRLMCRRLRSFLTSEESSSSRSPSP